MSTSMSIRIEGDMDKLGAYKVGELEQWINIEGVLADECQITKALEVTTGDIEQMKRRTRVSHPVTLFREERARGVRALCTRWALVDPDANNGRRRWCTEHCGCPEARFCHKRVVSLRELIDGRYGASKLRGAQVGYRVPRNSVLGKDCRSLLLIVRQIAEGAKRGWYENTDIEFFTFWMFVNVVIVVAIILDCLVSD